MQHLVKTLTGRYQNKYLDFDWRILLKPFLGKECGICELGSVGSESGRVACCYVDCDERSASIKGEEFVDKPSAHCRLK